MQLNENTKPALYPIGLNLSGKAVLIVGAGTVATRKLTRLIHTGALITVVSTEFSKQVLQSIAPISCLQQAYSVDILETLSPLLVFACTNSSEVNAAIAADCKAKNIWINSATEGIETSDFIVPSVLDDYAPLQIALFSGGASPMFLKKLREKLSEELGPWVGPYLSVVQELRSEIQKKVTDETQRYHLYEIVLNDAALLEMIQQKVPISEIKNRIIQQLFGVQLN